MLPNQNINSWSIFKSIYNLFLLPLNLIFVSSNSTELCSLIVVIFLSQSVREIQAQQHHNSEFLIHKGNNSLLPIAQYLMPAIGSDKLNITSWSLKEKHPCSKNMLKQDPISNFDCKIPSLILIIKVLKVISWRTSEEKKNWTLINHQRCQFITQINSLSFRVNVTLSLTLNKVYIAKERHVSWACFEQKTWKFSKKRLLIKNILLCNRIIFSQHCNLFSSYDVSNFATCCCSLFLEIFIVVWLLTSCMHEKNELT